VRHERPVRVSDRSRPSRGGSGPGRSTSPCRTAWSSCLLPCTRYRGWLPIHITGMTGAYITCTQPSTSTTVPDCHCGTSSRF
jgi:hypothetical protein